MVKFRHLPAQLQLYPRGQDDSATVQIDGYVVLCKSAIITLQVFKNGTLLQTEKRTPLSSADTASFMFEPKIHAELSEYKFVVGLSSLDDTVVVASADSVVCGDVYLINGQSNSHFGDPAATYRNEFCRSFGVHTDVFPYNRCDTTWGLSSAYKKPKGIGGPYDPFFVGVWGIRLQQYIKEVHGIPTCIINGGSGGSFINQNLANETNRSDLGSRYGRFLYRATKAGVQNNIKAMLWYQGESDSEPSWKNYMQDFTLLHDAWKKDYASLNKIYVFQIRPGCSDSLDYPSRLREVQRRLPKYFKDVHLMSTTAIPGHDGCHYNYDGYNNIASKIFKLIQRDFYSSRDTVDIAPPDVARAYLSGTQARQITVEFSDCQTLLWPRDTLGESLLNYFYIDGKYGQVISATTDRNKLHLILSQSLDPQYLSYLPARFYNTRNAFYAGPFLANSRGVGALSFHRFPIGELTTDAIQPDVVERQTWVRSSYPNPFNSSTVVSFCLGADAHIKLRVFDLLAREIRILENGFMFAGNYSRTFDAADLSSGIYICVLEANSRLYSTKLILLR